MRDGAGTAVESPQAFLFHAAANLAIDHQRRQSVRARHEDPQAPGDLEQIPSESPGPETLADRTERLEWLAQALAELPSAYRQAFILGRLEGFTHAEIVARMGISESMVAKHQARAMKHCRDRLRDK